MASVTNATSQIGLSSIANGPSRGEPVWSQTRTVASGVGLSMRGDGAALMRELATWPSVEFLARTIGRFDAVATVAAESTAHLRSLIEKIRSCEGVRKTETWVHLEAFKERYEWPKPAVQTSGLESTRS